MSWSAWRVILQTRHQRKRQEKEATTLTWESIQKIELCEGVEAIWEVLERAAAGAGVPGARALLHARGADAAGTGAGRRVGARRCRDRSVRFRVECGEDVRLVVSARACGG